jgi:hypothetical protein
MKVLGMIMLGLAAIAFIYSGVIFGYDSGTPNVNPAETNPRTSLTIPLALGAVLAVAGGALLLLGGKGYFVSYDPKTRN